MRKVFIFLLSVLGWVQTVCSQDLVEYFLLKESYPKAAVVCTQYTSNIEISIKDNQPYIVYETLEEFLYFSDNNTGYQKRGFHASSMYEIQSYSATLFVPSGIRYSKIEVNDFQVNDFESDHIFYDDSKEINFTFPSIGKGYKTVIKNRYIIKDPHYLPKFSLSPYLDYANFSFSIKIEEGVNIGLDSLNTQLLKWEKDTLQKKKFTTYTWKGSAEKSKDYEQDAPNRNYYAPQLHVRIKTYFNGKDTVAVLRNLDDLYQWNCAFVQQTSEDPLKFKSMSDSIVGNATNDRQKAQRIYEWVQKNIRYIALEYGNDGFIPAKASVVSKERYGDCKGMSNLLFKLLRSQGLEAYMVWIGTRDIPYSYDQLVSNSVSNHMITALKLEGNWIFLDGTASNLPFGMPSPFIQEKQAMIDLGNCSGYLLKTVPKVSEDENYTLDSCYAKLDGKTLVGNGIAQFHGFKKMVFADKLNERNYRSILTQCRKYVLKGNNRFILDTVWLENLDNRNLPLNIHYQFHIPDYALFVDNEYFINLNLDQPDMPDKIDGERTMPLEYRFAGKDINILNFEMPNGYKCENLPPNYIFNKDGFQFENSMKVEKNLIKRKQIYGNNKLVLEPEFFGIHNQLIEQMLKNYTSHITLHP